MQLRTYILLVTLLALLGLCTVHEVIRQTHARYSIGQLLSKEEHLRQEFAEIKTELADLRSVSRLDEVTADIGQEFVPLQPVVEVELAVPVAMDAR